MRTRKNVPIVSATTFRNKMSTSSQSEVLEDVSDDVSSSNGFSSSDIITRKDELFKDSGTGLLLSR